MKFTASAPGNSSKACHTAASAAAPFIFPLQWYGCSSTLTGTIPVYVAGTYTSMSDWLEKSLMPNDLVKNEILS